MATAFKDMATSGSAMVAAGVPVAAAPVYDAAQIEEQLRGIVSRLQALANEQVRQRAPIEERWLEDLRAFHGKYDPKTEAELKDEKRSRSYLKITRKKTNAWIARLQELLFPTDDRNWGIQPTPVAKLTKSAKEAADKAQAMADQANAQMQAGQPGAAQQTAQQGDEAAQASHAAEREAAAAKKASEAMQEEMDDQLVECQYHAEARDLIADAVKLGTGVIKGPMANERTRGSWQSGAEGWGYNVEQDPRPILKRVNPWSYFPDMSAGNEGEKEFDFERHLWTKKDIRSLVKTRGFNADAARRLLDRDFTQASGDVGLSNLTQLRTLTGEGEAIKGRAVGWEYHGPLECAEVACMMRAMALTLPDEMSREAAMAEADVFEAEDDKLQERRVIVWFSDGELLKIVPEYVLDSGESLYSSFTFEPGEASIFGYGIPHIMGDSASAANGAWRMVIDNAGLAVGGQVIIDKEQLEPQDGRYDMRPRKVWLRKKSQGTGNTPAFEFVEIPSRIADLLSIVREARGHADDETALPVLSEGEMPEGPQQTATQSGILASGSNVTFRRVVKQFDDGITGPALRRLYDWNMQFNKREDIKGDMSVDARGTSVLLVREIQSQILMQVASNWTVHQAIAPMLQLYGLVKKTLQSMMIPPDDVMVSEEDYKAAVAAMAEAAKQDPAQDPAVMAAQIRLKVAEEDGQTRLQIAQLQRDTEMMKLAEQHNMKLEDLKALLFKEKMHVDSKERMFAAEAGIERQNAEEARSRGEEPTGSGGSISNGTVKV